MAKLSSHPLKPNPYYTYRDPLTGLWRVVYEPQNQTIVKTKHEDADLKEINLTFLREKSPDLSVGMSLNDLSNKTS